MSEATRLTGCRGAECPVSCCTRGTEEPLNEALASGRFDRGQEFKALGIDVSADDVGVRYRSCSDGTNCKMDAAGIERPLVCQTYPYQRDGIASLYRDGVAAFTLDTQCPAVAGGVSPQFREAAVRSALTELTKAQRHPVAVLLNEKGSRWFIRPPRAVAAE